MDFLHDSGDGRIDWFRLALFIRPNRFAVLLMRWNQRRIRHDVEGPRRGGGGHSDRPHYGKVANLGAHAVKDREGRAVVTAGRLKVAVDPSGAFHVDEGELH